MLRKFIFLINPVSGTASKKLLPRLIAAAAEKHRARYEILPTVASGDYHFVRQKIKEENYTDVIICGGDGSVNSVVQDLREYRGKFWYCSAWLRKRACVERQNFKTISKGVGTVFTGKPAYIDGFMINDAFACMLCGLGFDAQVAHDFAKQKKRGLAYLCQPIAQTFFLCQSLFV